MSSSQRKSSKSIKKKSSTPSNANTSSSPSNANTSPISNPPIGFYVPKPIEGQMPYGAYPQMPYGAYPMANWMAQQSPPSNFTISPPESQSVPETQILRNSARRLGESASEDDEEQQGQQEEAEYEEEAEEEEEVTTAKGRTARSGWTDDEVSALGQAWVDCSEKAETGTNQSQAAFKKVVWESWCRRTNNRSRNIESIYSKWRNSNKGAMEFQGIYADVERQIPPSGTNGDDLMQRARTLYKATYLKEFNCEVFWRVVKDYEKWRNLESFDQFVIHVAKKHKQSGSQSQSSGGSIPFNLNFDPPRPMGRDKAKRKMRVGTADSNNTTSTNSSAHEDVVALSGNVQSFVDAQRLKDSTMQRRENMQLRDIIREDISNKTGIEYALALELKKDAARKLGIHFDE